MARGLCLILFPPSPLSPAASANQLEGIKNYYHHHEKALSFPMEGCKIALGTRRRNKRRRKTGQSEPITNHPLPLGGPFFLSSCSSILSILKSPSVSLYLLSFFQWCPCHVRVGWGRVPPTAALGCPFLTATQTPCSVRHTIFATEKEGTLY